MYLPSTRNIIYSYGVVFYESFYSELSYTLQPHAEAMAVHPAVSYTPYATPPKEQTGNIITFAHIEEGDLLSETRESTESGDKYDED